MVIRIIGVAIVGTTALLAGCGSDTASAPAPTPTSTVSNEDQIHDLIDRVSTAQGTSDVEGVRALTCTKYRHLVNEPSPTDVPPMNVLPLDAFAGMPPEKLADALGAEYAGASDASVRALADALLQRDEAAYRVAMAKVMAETMKIRVDKVENLVVNGDTATADVTLEIGTGGKVSYTTNPNQITLVKEGGEWKECTPPRD
jgi:hypothetical protein